eukprot:731987-Pyramimonas_sp.AAC.1
MAIARRDEGRVVSAHEARGSQENSERGGGPTEPPAASRARNDGHERGLPSSAADESRFQAN